MGGPLGAIGKNDLIELKTQLHLTINEGQGEVHSKVSICT